MGAEPSGPDFPSPTSPDDGRPPRSGPQFALVPCLFVSVALLLAWRSLVEVPVGSFAQPGPGGWPLLVCAVLLGAGLMLLWQGEPRAESPEEASDGAPAVRGGPLLILGACVFAAAAIEPLGYRPTTLLILVFFLGIVERRHPLVVLLVAGILSFGSYALLDGLLRLRLPVGLLGI